jgi:hypothetical protein
MYTQTRGINDESYMKTQNITQERPMRYMTENVQTDRQLKHSHPESIDDSNRLRMHPTRLNQIDRDTCELYGTAPYRMGRLVSDVDVESLLKFSIQRYENSNDKMLTEKTFQNVDDVRVDMFENTVDNDIRGRSTRVDQRNQSGINMNCRR